MLDVSIFFDGACSNNGAKVMGIGVIAKIHLSGVNIGEMYVVRNYGVGTSNEAEWMGCCEAMRLIKRVEEKYGKCDTIQVFSDSQVISSQFNGKYNINSEHLRKYYTLAIQLKEATNFKGYVKWIKRNFNQEADKMSKIGLCCKYEHFNFKI